MTSDKPAPAFSPWRVAVPVALVLLLVSAWVQWHARDVSIPRYCANPEQNLGYLENVLTQPRPADADPRRPYVVAAKLMFLVPQQLDEPIVTYLARVKRHLEQVCR